MAMTSLIRSPYKFQLRRQLVRSEAVVSKSLRNQGKTAWKRYTTTIWEVALTRSMLSR